MRLAGFKGWSCSCGKVHARSEQGCSRAEASARQEPPPKCLVLYAEGVATAVERGREELAVLHDAARSGCCGFVALRTHMPPDASGAAAHCISQLLRQLDGATPLQHSTKGLRVVVASGVGAVLDRAKNAGAESAELLAPLHDSAALAAQLVGLLGLNVEAAGVASPRGEAADVVVAHLQPAGCVPWEPTAYDELAAALNALVQQLVACPDVAQRLYLVLLLGLDEPVHAGRTQALPAHLSHLRPEQSCAAQRLGAIAEHALLCVHSLSAVVRRDYASCIGHAEFIARGARGTVLAEDVLVELAFKLGRASKYGA